MTILRLHGRNCPEPSPARRSASRQGSRTATAASVLARAALDDENAVVRRREQQDRPALSNKSTTGKRSAQADEGRSCPTRRSKKGPKPHGQITPRQAKQVVPVPTSEKHT